MVKFRRGLISAAAGRDDRAVIALRESVDLQPAFAPGWLNLGHAFMRLHQWVEAADAYCELLKLPLDTAHAWMEEAAFDTLLKMLGVTNTKAVAGVAHNNIGVAFLKLGQFAEAVSAYQSALECEPHADRFVNLGHAFYALGKMPEAAAALRTGIDLAPPGRVLDLYNLGNALTETGQHAEAAAAFREARKLRPDLVTIHNNLGWALASDGQLSEAIAAYRDAIRCEPKAALPYGNLGTALRQNGQHAEALTAYGQALERTTDNNDRAELLTLIEELGGEIAALHAETKRLLGSSDNGNYNGEMPDGFTSQQLEAAEREIAKRRGLTLAQYHAALDVAAPSAPAKAKPRPKWENRKGADATLSPPEFVAKHYAAEMVAGTLHRGVIAQEDKPLAVKLASWLRSHPMPEGIDIPTKPEWNSRQLASLPDNPQSREVGRLLRVARHRAERSRHHIL